MDYELYISEAADRDVEQTIDYIALRLHNPPAAAGFADRLSACYDRLAQNPALYALTPHPLFHALGIHKAPIGGYTVFYQYDNTRVTVVRVLSELETLDGKL